MATKKTTTEKKKTSTKKRVKKTKDVNITELEKSAVENIIEQAEKMTNEADPEIVEAAKNNDFKDLLEDIKNYESVSVSSTDEKANTSVTEVEKEEEVIGNVTEVKTDEKVDGNYKEKPIYKKKFDYNSFWLSH